MVTRPNRHWYGARVVDSPSVFRAVPRPFRASGEGGGRLALRGGAGVEKLPATASLSCSHCAAIAAMSTPPAHISAAALPRFMVPPSRPNTRGIADAGAGEP